MLLQYFKLPAEGNKKEIQTYEEVLNEIKTRDKQDMERKESPLHPARNAVIIDTTNLNTDEVIERIITAVKGEQSYTT